MQAGKVHDILSSIVQKSGNAADKKEIAYLKNHKLVEILNQAAYNSISNGTATAKGVETELQQAMTKLEQYQQEIDGLQSKLGSKVHRVVTSNAQLSIQEEELRTTKEAYAAAEKQVDNLQKQHAAVQTLQAGVQNSIRIGGEYILATQKGTMIHQELSFRQNLKKLAYEKAETEIIGLHESLVKRVSSFHSNLGLLAELGIKRASSSEDLALSLAVAGKNADGVKGIDAYLVKEVESDSYEDGILRTIAAIATSKNPKAIQKATAQVYEKMTDDGHSSNPETLFEAALIASIPGGNAKSKYSRFTSVEKAVRSKGFDTGDDFYSVVATLAAMRGTPGNLAGQLSKTYDALEEQGCTDSSSLGIATIMLMEYAGQPNKRTERFASTHNALVRAGMSDKRAYYPVAAALSVAYDPGEAAFLARKTISMLEKQGIKDGVWESAATLLTGKTIRQFPGYEG